MQCHVRLAAFHVLRSFTRAVAAKGELDWEDGEGGGEGSWTSLYYQIREDEKSEECNMHQIAALVGGQLPAFFAFAAPFCCPTTETRRPNDSMIPPHPAHTHGCACDGRWNDRRGHVGMDRRNGRLDPVRGGAAPVPMAGQR